MLNAWVFLCTQFLALILYITAGLSTDLMVQRMEPACGRRGQALETARSVEGQGGFTRLPCCIGRKVDRRKEGEVGYHRV